MEKIELEFHEAAVAAGVLVTSALGFDCVPVDVGTQLAASLFKSPARCTWVESFVSIHAGRPGLGGNFATYESAVYGYAHAKSLSNLRKLVHFARWSGGVPTPVEGQGLWWRASAVGCLPSGDALALICAEAVVRIAVLTHAGSSPSLSLVQAVAAKGKVDLKIPGPRPRQSAKPVWDARLKRWALPFPGEARCWPFAGPLGH